MSTVSTNSTFITIREAAQRLGVHENTVRRYVDRGLLKADRLPSGVRRIRRDDVEGLSYTRTEAERPAQLDPKRPAMGRHEATGSAWTRPIRDVSDLAIPGFWTSDEEVEDFIAMTRAERDRDR